MRIDHVTWRDVAAYLKAGNDTVLIPVGSTEQYGPHLAMGTETRIVEAIATEVGKATGFAVTPTIPVNYTAMFLDYPGVMNASLPTLEALLTEAADSLCGGGFRHLLFINIHAATVGPMEAASRTMRRRHGAVGGYIDVFTAMREVGGVAWEARQAPTGHAAEMVTSVALHVCPELVFMDRIEAPAPLKDFAPGLRTLASGKVAHEKSSFALFSDISDYAPSGQQGDARAATAEKGRQVWDNTVAWMASAAKAFAQARLPPA
jgi:creatinine amidohydrolase